MHFNYLLSPPLSLSPLPPPPSLLFLLFLPLSSSSSSLSLIDSPLDAQVWLLNSCTVKGPSEDGFKSAIRKGKELNKTLVVAGCVPQGQRDLDEIKDVSAVGVKQIDRIVEVVEGALNGNTVRLFGTKRASGRQLAGPSLELPKIRKNPLIEIIPINSG